MEYENTMPCLCCGLEIEDPICERCRTREVLSWMRDNNISLSTQAVFLKKLKKQIPNVLNEGYCALCYGERPSFCQKCYFTKVSASLSPLKKIGRGNFPEEYNFNSMKGGGRR